MLSCEIWRISCFKSSTFSFTFYVKSVYYKQPNWLISKRFPLLNDTSEKLICLSHSVTLWDQKPKKYSFIQITFLLFVFHFSKGDDLLANGLIFKISPLQIHCINRRLQLPLPTCGMFINLCSSSKLRHPYFTVQRYCR